MQSAAKKQVQEFTGIVDAIADERVRYFYLMLGDALAEATAGGPANTSPAHLAEIAAQLNNH